jgi:hypothetical protein
MIPKDDREAAGLVIDGLLAAGCTLRFVYDTEEEIETATKDEALDAIFAVDAAHLNVTLPDGERKGWVWFVLGNDPIEVVCDHTVNLSEFIDPITGPWWE